MHSIPLPGHTDPCRKCEFIFDEPGTLPAIGQDICKADHFHIRNGGRTLIRGMVELDHPSDHLWTVPFDGRPFPNPGAGRTIVGCHVPEGHLSSLRQVFNRAVMITETIGHRYLPKIVEQPQKICVSLAHPRPSLSHLRSYPGGSKHVVRAFASESCQVIGIQALLLNRSRPE